MQPTLVDIFMSWENKLKMYVNSVVMIKRIDFWILDKFLLTQEFYRKINIDSKIRTALKLDEFVGLLYF